MARVVTIVNGRVLGTDTSRAGLDADLAVLDRDLLAAGPSAIMDTGVALTMVGGRIVHRSEEPA